MGLFGALQMSGSALQAFTTGIQVAGQNISNANTPGYIREDLILDPSMPAQSGRIAIGSGVQVQGIRQRVNQYLETRLHAASGDQAAAQSLSDVYTKLQDALNELGDNDLSTSLSKFSAAVQNIVNEPDNVPLRQQLVGQGVGLARDVSDLRARIDGMREDQNKAVADLVAEVNGLIDQIDKLNPQITKLEAGGVLKSDAGALRTQRYNALQRLSEIVPIKFREGENGSVDIYLGSDYLLLGGSKQHLEVFTQTDQGATAAFVRTTRTQSVLPDGGGELRGAIDGRDQVLGSFVNDLDTLAARLIGDFNRLHSSGEGQVGYASVAAERGVTDTAATLNAAGLPFAVSHGGFDLKVVDKATGQVTTTRISIDLDGLNGNDTTLASLATSIGGAANVTASIDAGGRLRISAANGFELKFSDDTSGALTALGINTFFTGSDSSSIGVNAAIRADHRLLATGQGGGAGDNRNVAALADVLTKASGALQGQSITGFYNSVVSKVGQGAAAQATLSEGARAYVESLANQRSQYSGVSLDEETIKVMGFQRSFQAAARMISTIDQLMGVLLNM